MCVHPCVCVYVCEGLSEPLRGVLESSRPIPLPPLSIENCSLKCPLAPLCSRGQAFGPHTNMHTHTHTNTHTLILGSECESDISESPEGCREHRRRMSERITAGFIDSFPLLRMMRSVFLCLSCFHQLLSLSYLPSSFLYLLTESPLVSFPPSKADKATIAPGTQTDKT